MNSYWLRNKDNFQHSLMPAVLPDVMLKTDALDRHEIKYQHMYNNTYTGSIQYRGQSLGMPPDMEYYGRD